MAGGLDGVWRRTRLALEGVEVEGLSDVCWLQAGSWFGDLRTLRFGTDEGSPASEGAFSGRTRLAGPRITFLRDMDLRPGGEPDSARLVLEGDELVESGHAVVGGERLAYEERWLRAGPAASGRVLEGRGPADATGAIRARFIDVDGQALGFLDERARGGAFLASEYRWRDGAWALVRSLRGGVLAPPAGRDPAAGSWMGLAWRVRYAAGRGQTGGAGDDA